MQAEAIAHPNIALIKYWGNRDEQLRIPSNNSISITLGGLQTRMAVRFEAELARDELRINGEAASPRMTERASGHLDLLRGLAGIETRALIESSSDVPLGAGIASSAAAFAALSAAAAAALELQLAPDEISRVARRGSGSAARSVFGGYVELLAGDSDQDTVARQLAPPGHWEIVDLIALISEEHKEIGSTRGHERAASSPLQAARVADAPRRLRLCRGAIQARDFTGLARIVEQDSDLMHSVMMTSDPPLRFWTPETLGVMAVIREMRAQGEQTCYTVDAGSNVHCLCLPESETAVSDALHAHRPGLRLLKSTPGGPVRLV